MAYRICPECGAALDPGERCDCTRKQESQAPVKTEVYKNLICEMIQDMKDDRFIRQIYSIVYRQTRKVRA